MITNPQATICGATLPRWITHTAGDKAPIGSGVTEAACKTIFTQRFKRSGMKWKLDGPPYCVSFISAASGIRPGGYARRSGSEL